ncbi:hypothetical protein GCM10023080_079360 [Streptomyces pseudoechinosporeus]
MSTRIAVLEHGHLVEEGDAAQVTEHPTQPCTRRLIAASPQSDPDVQEARRATRKAIVGLRADTATDANAVADDPGIRILRALERQAVTEALIQPAATIADLDHALARFDKDPDDIGAKCRR